jgi:hypothetical protein
MLCAHFGGTVGRCIHTPLEAITSVGLSADDVLSSYCSDVRSSWEVCLESLVLSNDGIVCILSGQYKLDRRMLADVII